MSPDAGSSDGTGFKSPWRPRLRTAEVSLRHLCLRPTMPHRQTSHSDLTGDLAGRYATNKLQLKKFAHVTHGRPLCWHPFPPLDSQKSGPESARRGTSTPGRDHPEWWATASRNSGRNGGRHHSGLTGGFARRLVAPSPPN